MPKDDIYVKEWRRLVTVLLVGQTALLGVFAAALSLQPLLFALVLIIIYTVAGIPTIRRFFMATPEEKLERSEK